MQKSKIKEVILAITYQCNSRCQMCNIWKMTNPQSLSLKSIEKIPGDLRDINITGGEPFLSRDIVKIVKTLSDKSPQASFIISSNGFATELILAKMKEILEINPQVGVAISIDGIDEKHDAVRGILGGFQKSLATIEGLQKMGVKKLRLSFTLGDYNVSELKPVYALAENLGIELSLTLVHSSEQYFNTQNFVTQKDEMIIVLDWLIEKELSSWNIKKWLRAYYAYGMKVLLLEGKRMLPDYSGQEGIFIDPNGDIFPSDISSQKLGNLGGFDFSAMHKINLEKPAPSWMICTARTAIRKHWFKAGVWILRNKFLSF